jgi:hypothetical protein
MFGKLTSMAGDAVKNVTGNEQKPAEGGENKPSGQQWEQVGEMAKKVAMETKERQAKGEAVDYAALGELGKKTAAAYNADPNKGNAQEVGKNIMAGLMSGGNAEEQKPVGEQPQQQPAGEEQAPTATPAQPQQQ